MAAATSLQMHLQHSPRKKNFGYEETIRLLELWTHYTNGGTHPELGKGHRTGRLWLVISERMKAMNYNRGPEECKVRVGNLRAKYTKLKRGYLAGEGVPDWPYYPVLAKFLEGRGDFGDSYDAGSHSYTEPEARPGASHHHPGMFLSMSMEEPNEPLACNVDGGGGRPPSAPHPCSGNQETSPLASRRSSPVEAAQARNQHHATFPHAGHAEDRGGALEAAAGAGGERGGHDAGRDSLLLEHDANVRRPHAELLVEGRGGEQQQQRLADGRRRIGRRRERGGQQQPGGRLQDAVEPVVVVLQLAGVLAHVQQPEHGRHEQDARPGRVGRRGQHGHRQLPLVRARRHEPAVALAVERRTDGQSGLLPHVARLPAERREPDDGHGQQRRRRRGGLVQQRPVRQGWRHGRDAHLGIHAPVLERHTRHHQGPARRHVTVQRGRLSRLFSDYPSKRGDQKDEHAHSLGKQSTLARKRAASEESRDEEAVSTCVDGSRD